MKKLVSCILMLVSFNALSYSLEYERRIAEFKQTCSQYDQYNVEQLEEIQDELFEELKRTDRFDYKVTELQTHIICVNKKLKEKSQK